MSDGSTSSLSRRDRLRRVALLCSSTARNIAFYRAGQTEQAKPFLSELHPEASFWRQVNGNFLDMAVLDWCKLFGDRKDTPPKRMGKHHWRRVVTDPVAFERGLFAGLQLDAVGFDALIAKMRRYRDEFIAHLDDRPKMHIPELDAARAAIDYYYGRIVEHEARFVDLGRLPTARGFAAGYPQCAEEAGRIYAACGARRSLEQPLPGFDDLAITPITPGLT